MTKTGTLEVLDAQRERRNWRRALWEKFRTTVSRVVRLVRTGKQRLVSYIRSKPDLRAAVDESLQKAKAYLARKALQTVTVSPLWSAVLAFAAVIVGYVADALADDDVFVSAAA